MPPVMSIVALLSLTLIGCTEPYSPPEGDGAKSSQQTKRAYPDRPASGRINGFEITVDRAQLKDGVLTLRQGEGFFADREVKIFLFDKESMSERVILTTRKAFGKQHVHLSWRDEGDSLPKSEILMRDFDLFIRFGETGELGLPYAIVFRTDALADTHVSGQGFATYDEIKVVNGELDRHFDSFDTLRHVAHDYLRYTHDGAEIKILNDFGGVYSSSDKLYPHKGYMGVEYQVDNSEQSIAKLQYRKDINGWEVARQLKPDQLNEAHPLMLESDKSSQPNTTEMLKQIAARYIEDKYRNEGMIRQFRATYMDCNISSVNTVASCRFSYKRKREDDTVCHTENLLLRLRNGWTVERELAPNRRVSHQTGEVEIFEPDNSWCR